VTSEVLFYCVGCFFPLLSLDGIIDMQKTRSVGDQENPYVLTWAKFSFAISFA